jgi:hypothetical protein
MDAQLLQARLIGNWRACQWAKDEASPSWQADNNVHDLGLHRPFASPAGQAAPPHLQLGASENPSHGRARSATLDTTPDQDGSGSDTALRDARSRLSFYDAPHSWRSANVGSMLTERRAGTKAASAAAASIRSAAPMNVGGSSGSIA